MKKLTLLFLALAAPLLALTLEEAIEKTVATHPSMQQATAALKSARAHSDAARSAFWPTLDVGASRVDREHSSNQPNQTLYARASLNLFSGFRDRRLFQSRQAQAVAAMHEQSATRADLSLEAKRAFFEYHRASENLQAQKESLRAVKRQAADAEAFYEQGLIAAHERIVMRLEAANAQERVLQAKSALRMATLELESLIGQPLSSTPQPIASHPSTLPPKEELGRAVTQRSELQALQALIAAQRAQHQALTAGFLPTLDLALSQEHYSYESGVEGPSDQRVATATLNWQLFSGFQTVREREAAHYQLRQIQSQRAETLRQIELQLASAYERLSLSLEALEVASIALKAAQENYRAVRNRFENQLASATELIDAEAALSRAREQQIRHYYNQLQSIGELERITERTLL